MLIWPLLNITSRLDLCIFIMVSAVNSSATSVVASTLSSSTTAIQAQLQRDKRKLADCVTCPSSKTPEGKKNIRELSSKVNTEESQLKEASTSSTANQSADSKSTSLSSNTSNQSNEVYGKTQNTFNTNIGKNLDVFV